MCRSRNTFWKCRHLVSGNFDLCDKYSATAGRECDGYTSFARVIKRPCPTCSRRAAARPPSEAEQATAGAEELTEEQKLEKERRRRVRAWAPSRRTKKGKGSEISRYLESREALGAGPSSTASADAQAGAEAPDKTQ